MVLPASYIYPASDPAFINFPSRRSVVHSTKGIVSSTQPLATQAGIEILRKGGNAADAAVAVAAALNVTEPGSTGIGGDMFCLFYDAAAKKVRALNGSGRSGAACSLEQIRSDLGLKEGEQGKIPMDSVHAVTVPGAAAGWVDTVERFGNGKLSLAEVLEPAIRLAEDGFAVSELSATFWASSEESIRKASPNGHEILKKDPNAPGGVRAPAAGEIMKMPNMAITFKLLAAHGKKGFYEGAVAEALVKVVQDLGGHITLDDLKHHMDAGSEDVEPISLKFSGQGVGEMHDRHYGGGETAGVEVWEHPPNGQGIVALMALGMLQELEKQGRIRRWTEADHNSADHLHALIETLRIAFADAAWFVTDPAVERVPAAELLSPAYLAERARLFDPARAATALRHGEPSPAHTSSDTVYFCVTDPAGNAASFINSNYGGFGTAIVPAGCGFTLQNRGANFHLPSSAGPSPGRHPNALAPRKRPYHTIIPALITNPADGTLNTVYGVMGGFMQPQGHVQVLLNMLTFRLNPQAALDAPRICIGPGMPPADEPGSGTAKTAAAREATVFVEQGIQPEVVEELRRRGHAVKVVEGFQRGLFGRGQVIRRHIDDGVPVWSAGSDPRGDGAAMPLL